MPNPKECHKDSCSGCSDFFDCRAETLGPNFDSTKILAEASRIVAQNNQASALVGENTLEANYRAVH
ncbi:MAG: hypothetical protein WC596_00670 [Candidatus Shapirobacteria bacterium]